MRDPYSKPRGPVLLAVVFAALAALPTRAADPTDGAASVLAAAQAAIDAGRVTKSKVVGAFDDKNQFNETSADGRILVGFELGVGKWFDAENIYAYRAIYLTANGEEEGKEHGLWKDEFQNNKKVRRTQVVRTVRLRARPGYAVGGVTIRMGLNIVGMSLTYMKMSGGALDPQQAYESDWVGQGGPDGATFLGGGGAPVVGILGAQDKERAYSLGLCFGDAPALAAAPPAAPPPASRPPAEPRVLPPVERPAAPPPAAKPGEPADVPRWADVVAAPREAAPAEAPPEEAPKEAPKQAAAPRPVPTNSSGTPLLIYIVSAAAFLAVTGLVTVVAVSSFGRKAQPPAAKRPVRRQRRPAVAAPPTAATGLCERPNGPARRAVDDEVLELKEGDFEEILEPEIVELPAVERAEPAVKDDWPRLEI